MDIGGQNGIINENVRSPRSRSRVGETCSGQGESFAGSISINFSKITSERDFLLKNEAINVAIFLHIQQVCTNSE